MPRACLAQSFAVGTCLATISTAIALYLLLDAYLDVGGKSDDSRATHHCH